MSDLNTTSQSLTAHQSHRYNLRSNKRRAAALEEQHQSNHTTTQVPKKRRRLQHSQVQQVQTNDVKGNDSIKATSFLDLPAEIRNKIYDYYFDGLYVIIKSDAPVKSYDSTVKGVVERDHAWKEDDQSQFVKQVWPFFLSNKTIASEIHPIFWSSATFVFADPSCFVNAVQRSLIRGLPQNVPGAVKNFNSLKTLRQVRLHFAYESSTSPPRTSKAESVFRNTWLSAIPKIPAVQDLGITVDYTQNDQRENSILDIALDQATRKAVLSCRNLQLLSSCPTNTLSKLHDYHVKLTFRHAGVAKSDNHVEVSILHQ